MSQPAAAEAHNEEAEELPYCITPHIDVKRLADGGMEFVFGRSLHPGLTAPLLISGLAGTLGATLLSMVRAPSALVWTVGASVALGISATFLASTSWRKTRVIAESGRLRYRTRFLPGLGLTHTIPGAEVESIRRHGRRLRGTTVYQLRAHLRDRKTVAVGHGIRDKVEAASLASAMEAGLRTPRHPGG